MPLTERRKIEDRIRNPQPSRGPPRSPAIETLEEVIGKITSDPDLLQEWEKYKTRQSLHETHVPLNPRTMTSYARAAKTPGSSDRNEPLIPTYVGSHEAEDWLVRNERAAESHKAYGMSGSVVKNGVDSS